MFMPRIFKNVQLQTGQSLTNVDSLIKNLTLMGISMQFGFLKLLILGLLVIALGGFAYIALVDVPVQQQDITVDVPLNTH